jgi:hypothetical protein
MALRVVAFAFAALAGASLTLPEMAAARPGGPRAGGPVFRPFIAPRVVTPAFAGPTAHRGVPPIKGAYGFNPRAGSFAFNAHAGSFAFNPGARSFATAPSHLRLDSATGRFFRVRHHARIGGALYPFVWGSDASYIGVPYDPSDAVPAYQPELPPDADDAAVDLPAPPPYRASPVRSVNASACRSDRVAVPEATGTGEREITVIRC